jgi:hypothetical protein
MAFMVEAPSVMHVKALQDFTEPIGDNSKGGVDGKTLRGSCCDLQNCRNM